MNEKQNEKQNQKLKNNENPNKMKNEMGKKTITIKNKSWSGYRTWLSRTSLFNNLSFSYDNSHTPMVLIVGIENVRAL